MTCFDKPGFVGKMPKSKKKVYGVQEAVVRRSPAWRMPGGKRPPYKGALPGICRLGPRTRQHLAGGDRLPMRAGSQNKFMLLEAFKKMAAARRSLTWRMPGGALQAAAAQRSLPGTFRESCEAGEHHDTRCE